MEKIEQLHDFTDGGEYPSKSRKKRSAKTTKEISVKFCDWCAEYAWQYQMREPAGYTTEELFDFFAETL